MNTNYVEFYTSNINIDERKYETSKQVTIQTCQNMISLLEKIGK